MRRQFAGGRRGLHEGASFVSLVRHGVKPLFYVLTGTIIMLVSRNVETDIVCILLDSSEVR
jgi:hypothetical protein